MDGILSSKEVLKKVPFSRRHLYRLEQRGDFPTRIKVGRRKVGWRESEIEAWVEARFVRGGQPKCEHGGAAA